MAASDAYLPGLPAGPAAAAALLLIALLLAFAIPIAHRRSWALSFRRALLFFLLLALLSFGYALLPAELAEAARAPVRVACLVLAWVGIIEALQGMLFDLLLAGWLKRPPSVPRILRDFLTLVSTVVVLFLALRGTLGVNVTSLLATSAMLSVVLGLALQETLGSFFSGLALQLEKPLEIDDWIRVGDYEGQVTQISWRTVRIRTPEEDEVTIPNGTIARSLLVNYSRPTPAHMHTVDVRVHFRHPPETVIATLVEAMRRTPGVLEEPAAHALLWTYGENEIVYRARFYIGDYLKVNRIKGAVGERIWYGLRRAGIEIPLRELVVRRPPSAHSADSCAGTAVALEGVDVFSPLSAEERRRLAARLRPVLFGRGEAIIRQGEPGDSLFLLARGRVEIRVTRDGEEAVVGALDPGSVFGEMSLLTGEPRTATVVATEDVDVIPVAREDFRHTVAANPAVLEAVTRIVGSRRGHLEASIREAEEAAAARAGAGHDLLDRVRAFFGV